MEKNTTLLENLIVPNLYERYSSILSLSDIPILLLDTNGKILLELIPSPDFCSHICQKKENEICSDYLHQIKHNKKGRFICKYNLENIILPIIVHNETLGYIVGIRAYSKDNEYKKHMIDINSLKSHKITDLEFIARSISSLKVIQSNKIEVHEQLCSQIAKNIALDLLDIISKSRGDLKRLSIEKEILEKQIIELEAKNMSLVVNPHFLFNALNCIARIAHFENSQSTEELIYCLSDLLRYNLKSNNNIHTISAEIDNVEKYLYIQKVRFRNRLEYEINIPDNINSYKIPNMTIQPIVENAIIHGTAPKRDGGKINIYAEKNNKKIVFYIADNGNGFSDDILKKLQNSNQQSGLGFRNTDNRLKQYYGDQYGLEIIKSDYSGSTVTITIPTDPITR